VRTGRRVAIVNLDPANDLAPYDAAVSLEELISVDEVQEEYELGPNGAMVFCMEYLEKNVDWLKEKLEPLAATHYFIFDCPGQLELFNVHASFRNVLHTMMNHWHYRLCTVHLCDSHLCCDPGKYVSALIVTLQSMLHLETPHVSVLSKVDMMDKYGDLAFNLEYYTEVMDLEYLVEHIGNDPKMAKYKKLTAGLCEIIEDFGLVRFVPLAIEDEDTVRNVATLVDKSIGYSLGVHKGAKLEVNELQQRAQVTDAGVNDNGRANFDLRNGVAPAPAIAEMARNLEIQEKYFKEG
jgi:GTPase SAR1 family protein